MSHTLVNFIISNDDGLVCFNYLIKESEISPLMYQLLNEANINATNEILDILYLIFNPFEINQDYDIISSTIRNMHSNSKYIGLLDSSFVKNKIKGGLINIIGELEIYNFSINLTY